MSDRSRPPVARHGWWRLQPTRSPKWGSVASIPRSVLVGLLCLVLIGIVDLVMAHERGITGDEPFYEAMASHPSGPHNFPYAYRVGVPWLVHALPFSHVISWTLIGLLAVAVSSAALYELLRELRIADALSVGLVVGFALSPSLLVVVARHFRSIDPASVLVMILGVLFIVRRQRLALLITLTVGIAVRESSLFLVPFAYAFWARSPFDREALRDVVLTCLLPVAAYLLIRTSVDAVGKQYIPGYSGPLLKARLDFIRSAFSGDAPRVELRRLAVVYGPLWVVAPLALRDSRLARRGLVLVILCVAAMTYAYDWGRIIFLAAPVFFAAAGHALTGHRRAAIAVIVLLLALDLGYAIYLQDYGISHGLDQTSQHIPVY